MKEERLYTSTQLQTIALEFSFYRCNLMIERINNPDTIELLWDQWLEQYEGEKGYTLNELLDKLLPNEVTEKSRTKETGRAASFAEGEE